MADSAEKRATDCKSLADKEALKADTEDNLVELGEEHKSTVKELMATEEYISNLHANQKKSEDSGGVISIIDLIAESDKELTEAKTEEELAQEK